MVAPVCPAENEEANTSLFTRLSWLVHTLLLARGGVVLTMNGANQLWEMSHWPSTKVCSAYPGNLGADSIPTVLYTTPRIAQFNWTLSNGVQYVPLTLSLSTILVRACHQRTVCV